MYWFTASELRKVHSFFLKKTIAQNTAFNCSKKSILVKRKVRLEKYWGFWLWGFFIVLFVIIADIY